MNLTDQEALAKLGINVDLKQLTKTDRNEFYHYAIEKLKNAFNSIESSANHYQSSTEEAITSIISSILSADYLLKSKIESNNRGHVDLAIYFPTAFNDKDFTFIGEAKIWKGNEYQLSGFDQIMTYSTGAHNRAFTLAYFKIEKCDEKLNDFIIVLNQKKGGTTNKFSNRHFQTEHPHSSGGNIQIDHFGVNLFIK